MSEKLIGKGRAAVVGARPDNMAPTKTSGGVRVLSQGIDTLVFNVYGTLRPEVVEALDAGKRQAQASDDDWAPAPLPAFDGTVPAIHASGVKYYEWRCVSEDLTLTIARPGRSSRPAAVVRVSAKTLWRMGGGGYIAGRLAWEYLRECFEGDYRVQLASVHLARDYQGWALQAEELAGVVMRADGKDVYYGRGDEIESVAAGRSNRLRLNLYNKSLQVRKKALGWVRASWEASPDYRPAEDVWRAENQYGREFLRDCEIETLDQFEALQEQAWAYAAAWFSFRVPDAADTHRYRWAVLPAWAALAVWGQVEAAPIPRVRVVRPSVERLAQGAAGYLTSVMARCGLAVHEVGQALDYIAAVVEGRKGPGALAEAIERKQQRYGEFVMSAA